MSELIKKGEIVFRDALFFSDDIPKNVGFLVLLNRASFIFLIKKIDIENVSINFSRRKEPDPEGGYSLQVNVKAEKDMNMEI